MDIENSSNGNHSSPSNKPKDYNSDSNQINGVNGYSEKSKSYKPDQRDKPRDKDRERDKSKSKEHKSSNRDKDRHSSSSKDKERHSSSHKSSSRDKDRSERDKHREKDKHRDEKKSTSGSSSKDKEREHKSSHDKDHKSSSSKDKDGRDKERKDKEREKGRHSSSKDKEREKHSSSSKDKHRDKDRDKHHSSRDKDRRDREKDKKSDKDKNSDDDKKKTCDPLPENDFVKEDSAREDSVDEDDNKLVIKEDPESQDEIDARNVSAASSCDYSLSQFKRDEPKFEDTWVKNETEESEEDAPLRNPFAHSHKLAARVLTSSFKRKIESDGEDSPLVTKKKPKKEKKEKTKKKKREADYEDEDFNKTQHKEKKIKKEKTVKIENSVSESPKKGRKKKEEEEEHVWKWWEEKKKDDGTKWNFLEHKGPVFAPPYEPLPDHVKFYYDGKEMRLSENAEEVAGFYAKMLDHDYTTKDIFNNNFFKDWRKVMTDKERSKITDLKKCNFKQIQAYFTELAEKNRNRTKEEKLALKEKNEALLKEYGYCTIDGHKEKIGNFKIEPPGLFRGRGEHPKMGMLKRRVEAEDISINCSANSDIPKPPPGHRWREVKHDSNVTWLASWTENVQNQVKYIMLNPSSKLKGEKDWQKYETARRLHKCIDKIRDEYKEDWKSKEMRIRQRAVALYFIDKLALRAGNEKDEDQADTVGCCSLRVEHIELHERRGGKDFVVVFDFLGKDSIRYYNEVPVEKRVFKNLQLFMENKAPGDDLFDRLNTSIMNKHLNELMEGLTAKVFRTYNASWTLQQQLDELTNEGDSMAELILSYNRANRAVAILCNHQRSVPKSHEKSMEKLKEKIDAKRETVADAERQLKDAARDAKHGSVKEKTIYDKKKKTLQRLKEQLTRLEIQETDRDENKTVALGTSKLNYLDPRISVAWCKKYEVPIEKIYNKTQRDKFRWAIDMAGPDYVF